MEILEFAQEKLRELILKTEIEDRQRKKKRYISKVSAYKDLLKLLEELDK